MKRSDSILLNFYNSKLPKYQQRGLVSITPRSTGDFSINMGTPSRSQIEKQYEAKKAYEEWTRLQQEKLRQEEARRRQTFIGPADTRVSTQLIKKEQAEQRARQEAQQRSPLAQTFASFTPTGNPAAGAIGAEMFVNMNPITGPAMSAGRLTQQALGENPYGFDSNNAWWKNALANLAVAGDIVGVGMLGNMRLAQNAPASSQVLSRLNQQIRPLPLVKPQTVLQQAKPTASVIGKNVYEKVDPETGVSTFQESPITQRYASSSKPIFGRDEQGVFSEINGIRTYELLPPADEIVLGKPVRNSLLNITETDYNIVINRLRNIPKIDRFLSGPSGNIATYRILRDLGYDVGGMSSSRQIRDMVRTLSENINQGTNFDDAIRSTIKSYLTVPTSGWEGYRGGLSSNYTYDANSWTNRGSFLGNLVQKIKRQANTVDYQLGDFYRSLTAKTPPIYNQQSLVDEINQELAKGVGVKKTNLPLRIELNSGNQNINDFYLKTFIDDKLAGDINLVRNMGPYTGGPRKKLTEILFSDNVNNAYTKWLKTPGFLKRGDFPLSYYQGANLKQQGISGEFNKAINEVLKRRGFGNILSGGTGHSTLGKQRWENLVKRGLAEFLGDQYYKLKKKGGPIVNPRGFMDGEPPRGYNWRIPGDTLYNPTPNKIRAISDNGIEKTLNPFDETQVNFPGAQYVDEYKMKMGGLSPNKAREILHDGTVHGRPLTEKQRRFFGAMSKGNTKKYQDGDTVLKDKKLGVKEEKVKDFDFKAPYSGITSGFVSKRNCPEGVGCAEQSVDVVADIFDVNRDLLSPFDAGYRNEVFRREGATPIWFPKSNRKYDPSSMSVKGLEKLPKDLYDKIQIGDFVGLTKPSYEGVFYLYADSDAAKSRGLKNKDLDAARHWGAVVGFDKDGTPLVRHGWAAGENKGEFRVDRIDDISINNSRFYPMSIQRPKIFSSTSNQVVKKTPWIRSAEDIAEAKKNTTSSRRFMLGNSPEENLLRELPVAGEFSGASSRLGVKNKLVDLFNNKALDDELKYKLGLTQSELNKLKPVFYGMVGQESNFEDVDNFGRSLKELIGRSVGPAQIKLSSLTDEEKKVLGINSRKDLKDLENSYKAGLLLLNNSRNEMNRQVEMGTHPELTNADEYWRSLYFYNSPHRAINTAKDWKRAKGKGDELRMDIGSYPRKVMQKAEDLRSFINPEEEVLLEEAFIPVGRNTKNVSFIPNKQLGGNALAMLRDYGGGISVASLNSPLPKAQGGLPIKSTTPIISPILELTKILTGVTGDKKETVSNKPKVPEVTLERYFNVVDPRKVRATTKQPINPNVDLVAGLYPTRYITQDLKLAKQKGLSKEDAWNLAAIAFQESGWGKTDSNLGHVLGPAGKGDYGSTLINAYMNKMKEADRLGITDPYTRLQVYNGLGKIFPSTEQKYHGFKMKKIYGVPVPQAGLNLRENPLYGKQVVDIRENVLKKNPKLVEYIDSLYKKNGGSFGAFGYVGKGWYKNGGQHGGLDRWFAEKWVDVKTGKPCGRQEGESRAYPACRPSKRVSSKTPKTSGEMSSSEKAKFKSSKTSSQRIPYNHKRR
jgi:hypothetical protein